MSRSSRRIPPPMVDLVLKDTCLALPQSVEREEAALAGQSVVQSPSPCLPPTLLHARHTLLPGKYTSNVSPVIEPASPSARAILRNPTMASRHAFGLRKAPGKGKD